MGIQRIEFHPSRQSLVPGSLGTGEIQCLSVSSSSTKLVFRGWSWSQGKGGAFEIDPGAGSVRSLSENLPSPCGGPGGLLSPDGNRILRRGTGGLEVFDLRTQASKSVKRVGADAYCEWAPDGVYVVCVDHRRLLLVGASSPSEPRDLGPAGSGVAWSPDSRRILFVTSQPSCVATLYGQSLEVVDVQNGSRIPIKSSRCKILSGLPGWLDRSVAE